MEIKKLDVKDWVIGTLIKRIEGTAKFYFYRNGKLFYRIVVLLDEVPGSVDDKLAYSFPIDSSDLDGATLNAEEKPITLMRYIRKALEDETLVRVR